MKNREIRIERNGANQHDLEDIIVSFLVHPRDTGGKLSIAKLDARREVTINPVFRKNEDALIYVCEGDVEIRLSSHVEKLSRRDLAFIPRGRGYGIQMAPSTTALFAFSPGGVELPMKELAESGFNPFGLAEADKELLVWDVFPFAPAQDEPHSLESTAEVPIFIASDEGEKYWLAGDEYTIKLSGSQTQGRFCVVQFLIPPGGGPVPHIHLRDEEVFHILSGEASFYANGEVVSGSVGDTAILPRGIAHAFRNASSKASEFLTFVAPAGFDDFVRTAGVTAVPGLAPPSRNEAERERLMAASQRFGVKLLPEIQW